MSVRCFVGIPVPEEYKARAERLKSRWRMRLASQVSWTQASNWHITLKFLGNVPEPDLELVQEALAGVEFQAFDLKGSGGGFFPSERRPRVVWVGLSAGAKELVALAAGVEEALVPLGFAPEERAFTPHLTLARVKVGRGDPWDKLLAELDEVEWPEVRVDRFVLWRSDLRPQGAVHTPLREFEARS